MLKHAIENFRDFGLRGFHLRLSAALHVYRELGFYVCTAPEPREASLPLTYSTLRADELDEYCALRPDWGRRYAEERLECGGKCMLARYNGAIAGFVWAMERGDRSDYISRDIPPHPDEIYLADTFTQPSYRGQGVSTAVISQCCRMYFDAGKQRAVAAILRYNGASIRAFEKAGFRLVARRGYLGIGTWRRNFDRPVENGDRL